MSSLAHPARQGGDLQPDSLKGGGPGLQEPSLPPKNIQGSWGEEQPPPPHRKTQGSRSPTCSPTPTSTPSHAWGLL